VTAPFRVEPLGPQHDRQGFTCGVDALDRYFHQIVTQDIRRRLTHCLVAVDPDGGVAGYYTLAATSIPVTNLPQDVTRRLPRYPVLPAGLIGRLAVATRHAGQGLGSALIVDAIARASRTEMAIFALIVEAKDATAAAFYGHLGFRPFVHRPMALFLPLAEASRRLGLQPAALRQPDETP